jgi:hypothetical protein
LYGSFEILRDGGEMEFVARTRKPSEPHALEAVMEQTQEALPLN